MGKAAAAAFGPILGKTLFNIMHARATVQRTRAQNNNTVRHGNSNNDCTGKRDTHSRKKSRSFQSFKRARYCPKLASSSTEMNDDAVVLLTTFQDNTQSIDQSQSFASSLSEAGIEPWQLWFGFVVGLAPFVIASYEFGKRILIQKRCALCSGTGLIRAGKYSNKRKCTQCGGFLPWESWGRFFDVSSPGNGGVLRVPAGQTSVIYDVEKTVQSSRAAKAREDLRRSAGGDDDDDDDDDEALGDDEDSSRNDETNSSENVSNKRVEVAVEVERVDLRDGSVLFAFSENALKKPL
jgi:hypothetical protein